MGGEELTVELIEQLRVALAIAIKIGDKGAIYFVDRALGACLARWGKRPNHETPADDTPR